MEENAWDFESAVGCCNSDLKDAISAIWVLYESLEHEGFQSEEHFENWKAICFGKRFPMYLRALNAIIRRFQDIAAELDAADDEFLAKRKAAKATV